MSDRLTSRWDSSGPPLSRKVGGPAVEDQRCHFADSYFHRAGALPLCILVLSVMVCSVTGNLCDQKRETLKLQKGEVALVCPVTADVHRTKQSVVIYFVTNHTYGEVLACDWLSSYNKFDCLESRYGAEPIAIQTDHVLARLPEDRVQQNRSYRCQLVPNDPYQPFTDCHLCYPVVPKGTPTRKFPTSADHITSKSPKDTAEDEESTKVVFLTIVVFFLMVVVVAIGAFLFWKKC